MPKRWESVEITTYSHAHVHTDDLVKKLNELGVTSSTEVIPLVLNHYSKEVRHVSQACYYTKLLVFVEKPEQKARKTKG